jgi:hypothetical protein
MNANDASGGLGGRFPKIIAAAKIFEIGTTEKNKPGICFRGFPRDEKTRRLAPAGQEFAP